jgi:hypothetical protein
LLRRAPPSNSPSNHRVLHTFSVVCKGRMLSENKKKEGDFPATRKLLGGFSRVCAFI